MHRKQTAFPLARLIGIAWVYQAVHSIALLFTRRGGLLQIGLINLKWHEYSDIRKECVSTEGTLIF